MRLTQAEAHSDGVTSYHTARDICSPPVLSASLAATSSAPSLKWCCVGPQVAHGIRRRALCCASSRPQTVRAVIWMAPNTSHDVGGTRTSRPFAFAMLMTRFVQTPLARHALGLSAASCWGSARPAFGFGVVDSARQGGDRCHLSRGGFAVRGRDGCRRDLRHDQTRRGRQIRASRTHLREH